VAAEVAADGQPYFVFTDNNLGSKPAYLRALCRALRPLDRIWSAAVSLDVTDDPSLVREMALAGSTGVFVGFESLTHLVWRPLLEVSRWRHARFRRRLAVGDRPAVVRPPGYAGV
jgi:hypothetical protein